MEQETARARWDELDVRTAYELLRLRSDVFVVEQECAYPDLDGRDTEPTTEHRWVHEPGRPGAVLAYLRVLADPAGLRVGRVVTAPAARGRGLAGVLVGQVVADHGASATVVLDAQSHLAGWYGRHGFVRDGEDFVEDGIPHTPMARPAG
ncbi:GNAT family N-acetyltransferase [Aquipuribacter hungaricus]|uniref:GNAT family N-acetyltransferase n=1 Tax=Aquipuribacter hungaricus TaxID=545624 RepID=A0ABV7WC69_9MICO